MNVVSLLEHGRLLAPADGFELVSASVTAEQAVVAFWARTSNEAGAVITLHEGPRAQEVIRMGKLPIAHPRIALMPEGRVLIVGARASRKPSGLERNALLYDADGQCVREVTFGDGIEHVQTTAAGDIWVGYFDEGVLGSYGEAGIVRFDGNLEPAWEFPSHVKQPWGSVDDCYALNVADDAAWSCYLSGFPIVRIVDDEVTAWANEIRGAKAMAARQDRVALFGGYDDERHRLAAGRLEDGRLRVASVERVVMPEGEPIPPRAIVQGRGAHLHVIAGDRWLRLDPLG